MTFKSKRTLASLGAGILLTIGYGIFATSPMAPAANELHSWALLMLLFIGIGVVVLIVIQILFHIGYSIGIAVKEQEKEDKEVERILSSTMVEDEMDSLISLKAMRMGYTCLGLGFVAALVSLALNAEAIVALHILLGSMMLGSILEGCTSVYLYERGLRHG